ncbi:uncharacterized protein LOC131156284 [Malania oleifera]|uniref:uncharacterized protein LOC131156284 n=1 Tax=Malania oleifera TaxID=397392 RepID=UPI0025AE3024|nr:uncharacterized protein LOC131156284 [Malania oleifera]
MASFFRAKRVTDPLDDMAKARLIGKGVPESAYVSSSSSEQSADGDGDGDGDASPCLSGLVHDFLEPVTQSLNNESESEHVELVSDQTGLILNLLNPRVGDDADSFLSLLSSHVSKAVKAFSCLRSNRPIFRPSVMNFLRNIGYNAAICKAEWPSRANLTAGSYEYIDVVNSETRYLIDLDFSGAFEIARPTDHYVRLLQCLPSVYIGGAEELKKIVKAMCDEAKTSLKSRNLHLPPWRKNRYMLNKWFGPYRRMVCLIPATSSVVPPTYAVKCRPVRFDAAVPDVNGRFLVPAHRAHKIIN